MKFKKMFVALMAMGMLLSACGKKEETKVEEKKEEVQKVLKVGVAADFKPWCYKDGDNIVGIDVEVLNEVAKRMGNYKVEFQLATFEGMFGLLDTEKVDTVAQQITITEKRKEKYIFSEIYAYNPYKLMVREDEEKIKSIEDLKGRTFSGHPVGGSMHFMEEYKAKNDPNDEIKLLKAEISGKDLVSQGKSDASLFPTVVFEGMKKESGLPLKLVGEAVYEEQNAFPFNKNVDKGLLENFNKAIKSMREDGTLKAIYEKYFNVDLSKSGVVK